MVDLSYLMFRAHTLESNDTERSARAFALEYAFKGSVFCGNIHCMDIARTSVFDQDNLISAVNSFFERVTSC